MNLVRDGDTLVVFMPLVAEQADQAQGLVQFLTKTSAGMVKVKVVAVEGLTEVQLVVYRRGNPGRW